jgi:hypothetical protein
VRTKSSVSEAGDDEVLRTGGEHVLGQRAAHAGHGLAGAVEGVGAAPVEGIQAEPAVGGIGDGRHQGDGHVGIVGARRVVEAGQHGDDVQTAVVQAALEREVQALPGQDRERVAEAVGAGGALGGPHAAGQTQGDDALRVLVATAGRTPVPRDQVAVVAGLLGVEKAVTAHGVARAGGQCGQASTQHADEQQSSIDHRRHPPRGRVAVRSFRYTVGGGRMRIRYRSQVGQ